MFGINLKILRRFFGWNFAFLGLICAVLGIHVIVHIMQTHPKGASSHPVVFLLFGVFPAAAVVFGVAWWKIWKQSPSARFWGIAACVLLALHPLWRTVVNRGSIHNYTILVLAIAIAGLAAFSLRDKEPLEENDPALEVPETREPD